MQAAADTRSIESQSDSCSNTFMMPFEPPPAEVGDLAESCVRFVHDALGMTLDYTPDTLPILDHYLRDRARGTSEEVLDLLAPAAGAYSARSCGDR